MGGSPGSSAAPKQSCGQKKKAPAVLRRRCLGSWAICGRLPNNQVWVFRVKLSNWNSKTKNVASTDIYIYMISTVHVGSMLVGPRSFGSFGVLHQHLFSTARCCFAENPSEDILRPCFHWIRLEAVDVGIQEPGANHHLPAGIIQYPLFLPGNHTPMALETWLLLGQEYLVFHKTQSSYVIYVIVHIVCCLPKS